MRDKRPTTLAFVMRGTAKTGSRYSFYLDGTAYDGPWPFPKTGRRARRIFMSARSRPSSGTGRAVVEALEATRAQATVSFDPNVRPFVTPDRDAIAALVERQVALAHVVKASEEDLEWLYPGRAIEESLAAWAKSGRASASRRSASAARWRCSAAERISIPAPKVDVVDTVGAGDSFMSALLSAMDRGWRARRRCAGADAREARSMAALRRRRLRDHLHAQRLGPADPRTRSRRR